MSVMPINWFLSMKNGVEWVVAYSKHHGRLYTCKMNV